MSTDDSVSEDGSGSTAPGRRTGAGGKESEASQMSSEETSASGRAGPPGGKSDLTTRSPGQTRGQAFINPSSLEILRALMQEIQSSGETAPEVWKDCEGRWLHLFQLVEKQYQDQIVAQQQQYQQQIQLIQDEIKALVQLQNRQTSFQTQSDVSSLTNTKWSPDSRDDLLTSAGCPAPGRGFGDAMDGTLSVFTSTASPACLRSEAQNQPEGPATTTTSSGYGTLSAWESGPEGSPGEERSKPRWALRETEVRLAQKGSSGSLALVDNAWPNRSTSRTLTSWAQRHQSRKIKVQNQDCPDSQNQMQTGPDILLDGSGQERSDSAMSELSGLTYWRLHEDDLYRRLPDSLDRAAQPHLQEAPWPLEPCRSLREIYQNKQSGVGSTRSGPPSPQVLTLDPTARQSDRTSGFTSPSHFSSPSFGVPTGSGPAPSVTPDSMGQSSPNPADTDCTSEVSSVSTPRDKTRAGLIRTRAKSGAGQAGLVCGSGASVDPVVLSLLRQNLRDKHARHVSDLRAYYESEIRTLREQLQLLPEDLDKKNQRLTDRCKLLEEAVSEARQRVQRLEASNRQLEEKLTEWPQRYTVAMASSESMQRRLEQQDSAVTRLKKRVLHLEEQAEQKEAQRRQEKRALEELLGDYDTLTQEHSRIKNQLEFTEDQLSDANSSIVDLKKTVSKLEVQVKQLEHQNRVQARQSLHRSSQPSGAGLLHHPDVLQSPRRVQAEPDVTQLSPSGRGSPSDGHRCSSAEREQVQSQPLERNPRESGRRELTPVMRALIQLEETRSTESRAPWAGSQRNTAPSPDHRREGAMLRARRSLSPEGQRSSSLPPPGQRSIWATPTKKATLLVPISSKCSPKRCPTENFSTAFGHMMPREEHLSSRSGLDRRHSLHGSPRRRLHFTYSAADPPESGPRRGPADLLESQEVPETRIRTLAEAQQLCDELNQEKLQIEAALNRVAGARVGSQRRADQEVLEGRLGQVTRALVSARRALKRLKVLGSAAV